MKTMLDLLISLHRMEFAVEAACRRRQLAPGEERIFWRHLDLVREIIPSEVLSHWDRMKSTATDLLDSPELYAMAVLVAAYGSLPPRKRKRFLQHFSVQPRRRVRCDRTALERVRRARGTLFVPRVRLSALYNS